MSESEIVSRSFAIQAGILIRWWAFREVEAAGLRWGVDVTRVKQIGDTARFNVKGSKKRIDGYQEAIRQWLAELK